MFDEGEEDSCGGGGGGFSAETRRGWSERGGHGPLLKKRYEIWSVHSKRQKKNPTLRKTVVWATQGFSRTRCQACVEFVIFFRAGVPLRRGWAERPSVKASECEDFLRS